MYDNVVVFDRVVVPLWGVVGVGVMWRTRVVGVCFFHFFYAYV